MPQTSAPAEFKCDRDDWPPVRNLQSGACPHLRPDPRPAGRRRASFSSSMPRSRSSVAAFRRSRRVRAAAAEARAAERWVRAGTTATQAGRTRRARALGFPRGRLVSRARTRDRLPRLGRRQQVRALSATCTHLGCQVHWDGKAKKFRCPAMAASTTLTAPCRRARRRDRSTRSTPAIDRPTTSVLVRL